VADHDHLQPGVGVALRLDMHLRDKRAGRVDIDHIACLGLGGYGFRYAVRREYHGPIIGAFRQFLDKDRTPFAQPVDDEFIVHDLVAHINRRAPFLDGHFDDLDCAVDARTEPAWRGKIQGQRRFGHHTLLGHGP